MLYTIPEVKQVKMPTNIHLEDGIVQALPPDTSQHVYRGLQYFWSFVTQEQTQFHDDQTRNHSQYMLFSKINNETFTRDFNICHHKPSWHLFDTYFPHSQQLLIRASTFTDHERAQAGLVNIMLTKLAAMDGANMSLDWTGSAEIHAPSCIKKADQIFAPRDVPHGRSDVWPTLIIQSGFIESKLKLQADAKWWITESRGDVKTVLVICVHRREAKIIIQKWESPIVRQQVVVSLLDGRPEPDVRNGPLVVSFEKLFLRWPKYIEGDIVFTDDDLGEIAKMVWEKQKFI